MENGKHGSMERVFNVESLSELKKNSLHGAVICIGNFDGVHKGHQEILKKAGERARASRVPLVVFSFRPHPRKFFSLPVSLLTTEEEKSLLLESLGVDSLVLQDFDKKFSELSAKQFYENYLKAVFQPSAIFVGFNFRFGSGRSGNLALLEKMASEDGIQLVVVPAQRVLPSPEDTSAAPFRDQDAFLSSSLIRECLKAGKISEAVQMLGRPFFYSGRVIPDQGRGKVLGFPTANLFPQEDKFIVPLGVYRTRLRSGSAPQSLLSITNVGVRPTFSTQRGGGKNPSALPSAGSEVSNGNLSSQVSIETHIINAPADLNLYGQEIVVEIMEFIRPEKKFTSVDELKKQIQRDIESVKKFL